MWGTTDLPSRRLAILRPVLNVRTGAMARRGTFALALLVLVSLAGLASGCGGTVIDEVKLQDTTQASLEGSLHEKIKNVDCPSGLSIDPGSTFTCDVIFSNGNQMTATLRIRDKEADVSIVGLKANK